MAEYPEPDRPAGPTPDPAVPVGPPRAPQQETDPAWNELGATRVTGDETPPVGRRPADAGKPVVLGDYQLFKKLGEGAMGAVYRAREQGSGRDVALKVLFPHIAKNPKLVERLYREGRVMGQLDHPNLVQAYAIGEDKGCHYVAMEYVDGQSMQKWLTKVGRLGVPDAVRVTLDCARALGYAHELGIVHRDVKPDNVLVTRGGQVKVADLGMVKTTDEDLALTQTGHAVGTPWYMPLEQAKNAKDADARADIYALGCTLYCFLTGLPPFAGKTIVDVIQAKEVGSFPPARQANPDVSERLDLVIAKMTAKLPKYRYPSCAELIKDLEGLRLAGDALEFVTGKVTLRAKPAAAAPSSGDALIGGSVSLSAAPDADVWYVQIKNRDGTPTPRKFTTAQLRKMLTDGTIAPTAKASHSPTDGFRTLATYQEFQGTALSKVTKSAADRQSAKYRTLYGQLEAKERQRAADEKKKDAAGPAWLPLVLPLGAAAAGVGLLGALVYWLATGVGR